MKTKIVFAFMTVSSFFILHSAFGQGALTPPGAPAPTMKSLDQIEARTPITSLPFIVTNPGSYYLTGNLTGISGTDGINVSTGNVTIDLNGFALFGVSNSHSGIYISGRYSNVTVRNGSLSGWGDSGIDAASANPSGILLERLHASGNGQVGFFIGNGSMRDCTGQYKGESGALVGSATLISDCVFTHNTNTYAAGIAAFGGDCVVQNCQLGFNYNGVVNFGYHIEVHNSQINSNSSDGVYIYYNNGSVPSLISGCSLVGNGGDGIDMTGSFDNITGSPAMVSDCLVTGNAQNGMYLFFSPGSKVSNCNVTSNGLSGIYIGGDGSKIFGNNCAGNNSGANTNHAGILIFANECQVEENHLTGNGFAGIAIKFGNNSIVVKNTLTDGYQFLGANDIGPIGQAATATSPWANIYH